MTSSGSCQCGSISYQVEDKERLLTYACHCKDCQKRTGSAFSMTSLYPIEALSIDGELSVQELTSSKGIDKKRFSCSKCGNLIYSIGSDLAGFIKLQTGTLDDTSSLMPEAHLWARSIQPWISLPTSSPQYETQPDNPLEVLEAATQYRESLV